MHSKNFEGDAIAAMNCIRHSLDIFVMLALSVLDHGVDGGKLFRALGAAEVFSLLVVMQDDFIFKAFFTVEAEWAEARHVSLFSTHLL